MLRYAMLAGAAALAMIPGIGSTQPSSVQPSPNVTPSGAVRSQAPSDIDTSNGQPAQTPPSDQGQPPPPSDQGQTPSYQGYQSPGAQPGVTDQGASDMNRSGSAYQAQPGVTPEPGVTSDQSQSASAAGGVTPGFGATSNDLLNSNQQVVVAAYRPLGSRAYVQRAVTNDTFQFLAAQIALQRSNSQSVKDYANSIVDQHTRSIAILTPAANNAGIVPVLMLTRAQRDQLQRLRRAPSADFDRIYMNQQVTVHMNNLAVHQSYAANGDNAQLQQAAQQIVPIVQDKTNVAWNDSGAADRLADLRNNENDKLAQGPTRSTTTYRGYTVIGPTRPSQVRYQGGGYQGENGISGQSSSQSPGATGTPQYQGYTSQPAPGSSAQPGVTTQPGVTPGTPQYQGYTSQPSPGATAPGTSPQNQGYPPGTLNSPPPSSNMNTTSPSTSPNSTSPAVPNPNYTTPQTQPSPETNPH